jgi:hypothetical protein
MATSRISNKDSVAYLVSDVSNLYDGRTIIWRQQKVLGTSGLSVSDLNPPNPGAGGLDSIDVSVDGGVAEITWTFRSAFAEGQGQGSGSAKNEYELAGSTSQEPITSHPKYPELFEKYAFAEEDGEPQWFIKDPDGGGGGGLEKADKSQVSPLYGVRDFMAANAIYKEIAYYKGRKAVPGDLVSKCGKIDDPPNLQSSGSAGRWLRCGASIRQMGDSFQVTTMWMASQSAENLWRSEIYG